jgi:2-amino-4-hydroxy-6-hydroxymethyldihydropteridine diphosphokinase
VTQRRARAYVGLGANLGDAEATLADAVRALAALPGVRVRGVSRLYATRPVGVADQPDFRNGVVALDVPAGPDAASGALDLLRSLKGLERAFGRRRRRRWGPRELDLDLLVFGRARLAIERPPEARSLDAEPGPPAAEPGPPAAEPGGPAAEPGGPAANPSLEAVTDLLVIPHPAAHERLFVLAPLADLAPGLVPPGWGMSVETARRRQLAREGPDAVRPIAAWDPATGAWIRLQPR